MKHYFIINPASGSADASKSLPSFIEKVFETKDEPYEIYITKEKKDSYFQALKASENLEEDTIFYACGGDGTSFDVINGIMGKPHAYFGVLPVGSCNDFLKTFKEYDFKDFEKIINGTLKPIDVCKANDLYYINELNIGFDALVNDDCNKSKIKEKNIKKAYNQALFKELLNWKTHHIKAYFDGKTVNFKALLLILANGQYYGSKYRCAPLAKADDGLMDFVVVDKVPRLKFIKLIGGYERGEHINNPKYEDVVHFRHLDKITLSSDDNMVVCLDGEIYYFNEINIQVLHNGIKMLFPKDMKDE